MVPELRRRGANESAAVGVVAGAARHRSAHGQQEARRQGSAANRYGYFAIRQRDDRHAGIANSASAHESASLCASAASRNRPAIPPSDFGADRRRNAG